MESGKHGLFSALRLLFVNKPFVRLIIGVFFLWLGGSSDECVADIHVRTHIADAAFGISEVCPDSIRDRHCLSPVVGQGSATVMAGTGPCSGEASAILWSSLCTCWVTPGDFSQLLLVALVHGPIISVIWVMPPALIADTIEYRP